MGKGSLGQELRRSHTIGIWVGGGLTVVAALGIRLWAGSPHLLIHALSADVLIPPLWVMGLLWLGGAFLFGATCGAVLCMKGGGAVVAAWRFRGGMYFLLSVFLGLLWYPLLFRAQMLWLSWLILLLSAALAAICILCWGRILRLSLLSGGLYLLWLVFLAIIQLSVLLH